MRPLQEETRVGPAALAAVTDLLQRRRAAHPTAGLFEAADHQWSWRTPRRTDDLPQIVWLGDAGRVEAAFVATDEGDVVMLDPIVLPEAGPDDLARVVERGLAHVEDLGLGALGLEVDRTDDALIGLLAGHGFAVADDGVVESWLALADRLEVSALADGYRSTDRASTRDRPHHMTHGGRNHPDVEPRLRQTSLYRADLDLVVLAPDDDVAAYGLCWFDPVSATGLVEPMRTEDAHQRRGLARHVLTTGLVRLAALGAEQVKICFEPGNPASSHLYLDVGFVPHCRTDVHTRSAR